jgi:N-methylhydantoinase A
MRVATDIGGTFTDLVYLDEKSGRVGTAKVDTTPPNFEKGVADVLRKAGVDIASIALFVHGTTVIINAITERKGSKTGLITTRGFRDVLEITRANRPDIYNLYYTKPKPFVPRHLRLEASERINYKGEVLVPLKEEDVERALAELRREGAEAISVCFLHSYANPAHEIRCGQIIERLWPEVSVTLSHEVTKEWREYERTSTAALNSYVKPIATKYLDRLERELRGGGLQGGLYIMRSNGGTSTFPVARGAPIAIVESGPAAGVLGAKALGELIGEANLISLDMGGTTAKCSLIEDGEAKVTTDYRIEQTRTYPGYPIKTPVIDIVEIGSGGGSIAWIDGAGALHVGPRSAGALPGPACYGRGGGDPTITDASVIAGRVNPNYFLGGEIRLDVELSRGAMEKVATPLGVSVEEAALGAIRLADASMAGALKLVSLYRGYDPRDFTLVAFGGAGPMHASSLAPELGVKRVLIPTNPAVFSAWGMLTTDLRYDMVQTRIARLDRADPEELNRLWEGLEEGAREHFTKEGIEGKRLLFQRYADMRYSGQEHTVKVPLPNGRIDSSLIRRAEKRFQDLHEQYYTFRLPSPVEFVNFHLMALGRVAKPGIPKLSRRGDLKGALKGYRPVEFDRHGRRTTPIYERAGLGLRTSLTGPAIVEEPDSTTLVLPGQRLRVDSYGNLIIETED